MTETIDEDEEVLFGEAINRGSKLKKTKKMQDCFCFKVAGYKISIIYKSNFKDSLFLYHCFPGSF